MLRQLPGAGSFFALSREASVVLAEGGADGLRKWLDEREVASKAVTGAELTELARLQYLAGERRGTRDTWRMRSASCRCASADMFDGSQIRHEYSASLFHAGIELKGGGDARRAPGAARSARPDAGHLREKWRAAFRLVFAACRLAGDAGKDGGGRVSARNSMEARLARHVARARRPVSRSGQDARRGSDGRRVPSTASAADADRAVVCVASYSRAFSCVGLGVLRPVSRPSKSPSAIPSTE